MPIRAFLRIANKIVKDERTSGRADERTWRKSQASTSGGNCVELALLRGGLIGVRDSKDPHGPYLVFTPAELAAFADGLAKGEFSDLLQPGLSQSE